MNTHSTMPQVTRVLAVFMLVCGSNAAEWTLGITSFNNPKRLTIEAEPGTAIRLVSGTRRIVLNYGSTAGLLASGNEIDLFAQRISSTGRHVRVTGFDGGPARFSIRDGIRRRVYICVLEITAAGGVLRTICRVPAGVARPAEHPRHREFDFCDQAHCGFSPESAPR